MFVQGNYNNKGRREAEEEETIELFDDKAGDVGEAFKFGV